MDIQEEVKSIVKQNFEGSQLFPEVDSTSHRLSGFLIWEGFAGLSQTDRQKKLWSVLRQRLGTHAAQVSTVFTYTPSEYETLSAA